ncbi:MAG: type IX secretion system membrane protein PorP/SprF [Endomicrobia bacterium]|nr:type IX secretion system membrane protein PorP/SprF [Endomicrobiia bacterium]
MKSLRVIILMMFALCIEIFSAFYNLPEFGEVYGVGGAGSVGSIGSVESIFYNPAGLAILKRQEFISSYNRHIYTDGVDIDIYNIGYAIPLNYDIFVGRKVVRGRSVRNILPLRLGLGVGVYGMDVNNGLYKENIYSLVCSSKIDVINKRQYLLYGISLKLLGLEYGSDEYTRRDPVFSRGYSRYSFTLDIGFGYFINNSIIFGINFVNLLPAEIGIEDSKKELVKSRYHFGCSYRFYYSEVLAEIRLSDVKVEEYVVGYRQAFFKNKLRVSFGVNSSSANFSVKYKIKTNKMILEPVYSFSYPYNLISFGSHNLTLKIKF